MITSRNVHRSTLGALALGVSLCFPGPARAETEAERAAKLYQQGNAALEQKKWPEAEAAYREAWKLARTFDVAANLGLVELRLGNHRAAAELLAYSIRTAPPSAKAAQRQRTQQLLEEASAKVGTVRVKLGAAGGGEVSMDGARVAAEDVGHELFVDPGGHVLEARREGFQVARASFEVKAGEAKEVALVLVAVPPERRSLVPVIVLAGVGVAALGVGIGTTVVSNGHRADSRDLQRQIDATGMGCVNGANATSCAKLDDALSKTDTFRKLAIAGYVGAGVAAVAATTYLLWPAPKSRPASGFRVLPLLGPATAGLVAEGGF